MRTLQGISSLLFLFQLQCCNAVLKLGTARPSHESENALVVRRTDVDEESIHGQSVAGRRKFRYLVALQEWQRVTKMGISCPKPEACECHCDCPNTVVTGEVPTSPPACPVFPSFPTPPPPVTTTKAKQKVFLSTPPPKPKLADCKAGQVQMSDGTCQFIDMKVINTLLRLVESKRAALVVVQLEYNSLHEPKCSSCPGAKAYYEVRGRLVHAHEEYRAALGLFLNALGWLRANEDGKGDGKKGAGMGPEFVPGKKKLRPHCEPWTVNGTKKPDDNMCAVVCRNQPSCVGFARDPDSDWCLWFDDVKPQSEDICSSQTETKFLKKWQGPQSKKLWTSMEKIHVFDKAIVEALKLADSGATSTNKSFVGWWDFGGENGTVKIKLKDFFLDKMDDYTGTLLDTFQMRKQYIILQTAANELLIKEAKVHPGVATAGGPPPPVLRAAPEEIVLPEGFQPPISDAPNVLKWVDFPNSDDTAWSKIHPDCPMGTPCVCDCKCRGAPPQNFVEPPPPPPVPCPPAPPLPPPGVLSAILR